MKKFTLMALALMASAASFAQTTLWDGEDTKVTSKDNAGFWADGSPVLDANPETDGINTSAHCLKFTMTNDNKVVKLPFKDWMKPALNGSKRISMMVKKSQDENMMIELSDPTDGSAGYWHKVVAWYGGGDKWQKVVFDFSGNGDFDYPGIMTITAQTANVEREQIVYIDNIVIEDAPKVNGELFSDKTITGNVKLTGAWMKGECFNADGTDWAKVTYNDFEYFHGKADEGLTSVDMRGTVTKDVDADMLIKKNPNALLYADVAYDHVNVVAPDANGNLVAKEVVLNDANDFNAPYGFKAEKTTFTRNKMQSTYNSFVLPFFVSASDLNVTKLVTFKDKNVDKVNFETTDGVDSNKPFIAVGRNGDEETQKFVFEGKDHAKYFDATPTEFAGDFKGVYAYQSAEGKWGINKEGKLQKGGAASHIGAFHAYLEWNDSAEAPAFCIDGEATGINAATINAAAADGAVYDLSGRRVAASLAAAKLVKGVYVVNGKKFIVK